MSSKIQVHSCARRCHAKRSGLTWGTSAPCEISPYHWCTESKVVGGQENRQSPSCLGRQWERMAEEETRWLEKSEDQSTDTPSWGIYEVIKNITVSCFCTWRKYSWPMCWRSSIQKKIPKNYTLGGRLLASIVCFCLPSPQLCVVNTGQ